jgi:hypothetical protein
MVGLSQIFHTALSPLNRDKLTQSGLAGKVVESQSRAQSVPEGFPFGPQTLPRSYRFANAVDGRRDESL